MKLFQWSFLYFREVQLLSNSRDMDRYLRVPSSYWQTAKEASAK